MTALFLYIKHNCPRLWASIEWLNGLLFLLRYGRVERTAAATLTARASKGAPLARRGGRHRRPLALLAEPDSGIYALLQSARLRLFSTVSENNKTSLKASAKVTAIRKERRLDNGYLLIEWDTNKGYSGENAL